MKKLVIIGAGGFSQVVAWVVEEINNISKEWDLLGYIDEDSDKYGQYMYNYPVLGDFDYFYNHSITEKVYAVCSVGSTFSKMKLVDKAEEWGFGFANLIHPSAIVAPNIEMGVGNIICPGNVVSVNVNMKNHILLNYNCTVGHDAIIENYSTILPGVNIAGNVHIGTGCNVGAGANIIQGISVGDWATLGAGAVAIQDMPPNCTAVGVPAKPVKFIE